MTQYDAANKCPKCGDVATTKYDTLRNMMVRKCCRCGYTWTETPLDKRSPEELMREVYGIRGVEQEAAR